MANKTERKKSKFKAGNFTSGDARAYLFIHLSKLSNCITEFSELTRTPSRKYVYLWKAIINTAAKNIFSTVVLLYDEGIFIDILENQPPNVRNVNSYRKVLQTCSEAVRSCR